MIWLSIGIGVIVVEFAIFIILIWKGGAKFMAEIDDLKAAVIANAQAQTDVVAELNDIATQLHNLSTQTTINPADVESAAQSVSAQAKAIEDGITAAKNIANPPATPTS